MSPIQCVPKQRGNTVVPNEKEEMIAKVEVISKLHQSNIVISKVASIENSEESKKLPWTCGVLSKVHHEFL